MDKNIYGLTDIYPVKPHYLDVSKCAETFHKVAETWWYLYETFSKNSYKNVCLKEYYKWTKYARIFEKG